MVRWIAAAAIFSLAGWIWGLIEARLYHRRTHRLEILPPGSPTIRILQISDTHLRPAQKRLIGFLEGLSFESYDLVIATGDLLGDPRSVDITVALLDGLKGRYGRLFVLGSADYYAPRFKNYLDYFRGKRKLGTRRNPTLKFTDALAQAGWTDLTNSDIEVDIGGMKIQITGLDDPYMGRDDPSLLVRRDDADVAICVVHDPAPFLEASRASYDLVISGHTHGGQVRVPKIGALVTNSELPRQLAKWSTPMPRGGMLFVSPGLGTGRYAPFRFLSRPEASILELVAKP